MQKTPIASRVPRKDDGYADALLLLDTLGDLYDEAFSALQQGELERITRLFDAADGVLEDLQDPEFCSAVDPNKARASRDRARAAHGRLADGMVHTSDAVRDELHRIRRGKRGIKGYGNRGDSTVGHRISSKA